MEKLPQPQSDRPLLVLHVNDSMDDQVLFQAAVQAADVPIQFHVVDAVGRAISYLQCQLDLSRTQEPRWIDMVLLDIVLQDGSGLTILRFIRESPKLKHIPVIVLTGSTNPVQHQEARDLGATAIHEKPADFDALVALAETLYEDWSHAHDVGAH